MTKKTKKVKKQPIKKDSNASQISQQAFGLDILKSTHPDIKKLKRQHPTSIHGNKFWGSSYLLMDYFRKNPLNRNDKVLEIGCGWSLASIYLNKNFGCAVTVVDADKDVFPYAKLHADMNDAELIYKQSYFEKLTKSFLSEFDIIIAADVCFWDELSQIHFNLIKRALQAGVSTVIYADPERAPFTELSELCQNKMNNDTVSVNVCDSRVKSLKASGKMMLIKQHVD